MRLMSTVLIHGMAEYLCCAGLNSGTAEMKAARALSSKRSQRGTLEPVYWPVSPTTQEAKSGILKEFKASLSSIVRYCLF